MRPAAAAEGTRGAFRPSPVLLLPLLALLFAGRPLLAEDARDPRWMAYGRQVCEARGEGLFVERYDNGEVKASLVCAEHEDEIYVKNARYFDSHGRGAANEENDPADPSRSRYLEWIYEADAGAPVESRLYDGRGVLLEKKPFVAERPRASTGTAETWIPGTYNAYLDICRSQPDAALGWMAERGDGRQFFPDACPCLAEKAVRVDEERDAAFFRAHRLDPARFADRLTVAAARHLTACLCSETVPGTRLQEECRHAADVEKAWGATGLRKD